MRTFLGEKRKDAIAGAVIRAGGVLVILVVAAIVLDIGLEALPLFRGARAGRIVTVGAAPGAVAAGTGARREVAWVLSEDGAIRFPGDAQRTPLSVLPEGRRIVAADLEIHQLLTMLDDAGKLTVGRVRVTDRWHAGERTATVRFSRSADPLDLPAGPAWTGATANADDDGDIVAAAWGPQRLTVARWSADDEEWEELAPPTVDRPVAAAVAGDLVHLAVVEEDGRLRVFRLANDRELAVEGLTSPITRVRFLIGGGTVVAGGRDGTVATLLFIPRVKVVNGGAGPLRVSGVSIPTGGERSFDDDQIGARLAAARQAVLTAQTPVCRVVRRLKGLPAAVVSIAPSHRRRGFLAAAEDGTVALYHATSGRRLLADRWPGGAPAAVAMAPKGDGAVVVAGGVLLGRSIDNPHPEASLRTLFLPVHYEGYARPRWVWQSTGGSDAFEPKLSLVPLLFGTLKATLYAMLLSVPLALAAALYVSQLGPRRLHAVVKPTVELMAAVPSVVVGFLAALWLAPRLEHALMPSLLGVLGLPLAVVVGVAGWRALPRRLRTSLPAGSELAMLVVALAIVLAGVTAIAGPLESRLFGGDLPRWLFSHGGLKYDQRNSLVVGLALGFAVIPVIFTIAEDAFSAVPRSLVSAARALGATRWQTAARLVVPAASPGVFAAVILGLGRAVGETMIVLMAAGNTPLLDLSPFNGMRTMSAAIAVEIPEAPVGGTLFRVLFLTGLLLFVFTFILTTAADLVGRSLRRRYGRF